MPREIDNLLQVARRARITPEQQEAQRRSFAYGNTAIENDLITREMIDQEAERLKKEADAEGRNKA